jgi:hypothetical protein
LGKSWIVPEILKILSGATGPCAGAIVNGGATKLLLLCKLLLVKLLLLLLLAKLLLLLLLLLSKLRLTRLRLSACEWVPELPGVEECVDAIDKRLEERTVGSLSNSSFGRRLLCDRSS